MGMGTGKVAIQAFLQFRNLEYVYGVELSVGRYLVAEAAALCMVQLLGEESFHVDVIHGEQITVTELVTNDGRDAVKGRTLRLQCGNMMDVKDINIADIIMMETDLPAVSTLIIPPSPPPFFIPSSVTVLYCCSYSYSHPSLFFILYSLFALISTCNLTYAY